MTLLLGLDTGGTFTDAVLYDPDADTPVRASAKALTTREDLSIGITGAIASVLAEPRALGSKPTDIGLVSLSTTLATNALVEGLGRPAALVFIGFDAADQTRAGLAEALGPDPLIAVSGGHTTGGTQAAPLDLAALGAALDALPNTIGAVAVCARFGTRNTAHEQAARDLIVARTGLPVTCGHELAADLNGPRRAVTALLNARLIGMIADLIARTRASLASHAIDAPLMLVRGDGALIAADLAAERPIETILSGPAASLVGARALTGADRAVVADIGGTTTDIAVLEGGQPRLSPHGARVGGHQTMVRAAQMTAIGLGGDSEISVDDSGLSARLILGPRRTIPVSLFATEHPALVAETLARQGRAMRVDASAARFVRALHPEPAPANDPAAAALLEVLSTGPQAQDTLLAAVRGGAAALGRLRARGRVQIAGLTPSDAAHVLGLHDTWDAAAARGAAALIARRRDGRGQAIAADAQTLAEWILTTLTRRSADEILDVVLAADGLPLDASPGTRALREAGLRGAGAGGTGLARIDIGLAVPLVGLGASAPVYYPDIAAMLGTRALIPADAGVATAVGAVAGQIQVMRQIQLSPLSGGGIRIHDAACPDPFPDLDSARARALACAQDQALAEALRAGATDPQVTTRFDARTATVEDQLMFIEGRAIAVATGRPRLGGTADGSPARD